MTKDQRLVGLQFLLFGLYVFEWISFRPSLPEWVFWTASSMAIMGVLLLLVAMVQLGRNLSPFPTPKTNSELVVRGLYRWMRHPIYTGILLITWGYAIAVSSPWKLLVALALLVLFHIKSRYEEDLLKERFDDYTDYMDKSGRFLPRL